MSTKNINKNKAEHKTTHTRTQHNTKINTNIWTEATVKNSDELVVRIKQNSKSTMCFYQKEKFVPVHQIKYVLFIYFVKSVLWAQWKQQ